jgi:hypothetical protein
MVRETFPELNVFLHFPIIVNLVNPSLFIRGQQ